MGATIKVFFLSVLTKMIYHFYLKSYLHLKLILQHEMNFDEIVEMSSKNFNRTIG